MIPVDQTTFGDGSDGKAPGNCFAACIASILEMRIDQVPNFCADLREGGEWHKATNRWLRERGLMYLDLAWTDEGAPDHLWTFPIVQPGQIWIAAGPAERDGRKIPHCVVMQGPERTMLHDPNPRYGRSGIERIDCVGFLIPLDLRRSLVRCRSCRALVTLDRYCYAVPTCHACLSPPMIQVLEFPGRYAHPHSRLHCLHGVALLDPCKDCAAVDDGRPA